MKRLVCCCLVVLILVAACGRIELYQNLTEEEANEILVLLSENNIRPIKKKVVVQNETSYTIEVREADMVKARSLLLQHNLPRHRELGLTGVYKEKGLIPTPDEQKARFLLALKGEIINSLERIPQVIDADVVLNIPVKDEFASADAQQLQRPTASVVIKVKPDAVGLEAVTEPKIQQFVSNAVEGMNPRDVTVIISYLQGEEKVLRPGDVKTLATQAPGLPPAAGSVQAGKPTDQEIMGLKLDAESKGRLKAYLLVFFLLLVFLSSGLIVAIVQGSRMRRTLAALQGPAGEHPAIEGQILDEGPPRLNEGNPEDEL
jgi:type III secretion protein J